MVPTDTMRVGKEQRMRARSREMKSRGSNRTRKNKIEIKYIHLIKMEEKCDSDRKVLPGCFTMELEVHMVSHGP